ncbi:hypothetical protein JKF63_00025 [Porcisia hertigi]|uniref:Uncharacterized protein n=1 Tax=Porcisia hertigi TaxID=2761500 RepID=A0A836L6F0_9TRYP|nr:hypothetical protein JKF63_00025 [Porcisia hertigi]
MRWGEAEARSSARFFVVGMLVGLCSLLVTCGYGLGLFQTLDEVEQLNAAIRAVEKKRVESLLDAIFPNGTSFDRKGHLHPLYALTCVDEQETEEAREMIRHVAHRFRAAAVDVDYAHHPLTAAYRHNRDVVAQALIEEWRSPVLGVVDEDAVMDEVYASALSAEELQRVDSSVYVYCRDDDAIPCQSINPARIRDASSSRLEAAYRRRFGHAQEPPAVTPYRDTDMSSAIVAPGSTIRTGFWDDPFRPLIPDLLPPRSVAVMNPGYFDSFVEQLSYTFLGHMKGSSTVAVFAMFAVGTVFLFLGAWCVGMTYWLVCCA